MSADKISAVGLPNRKSRKSTHYRISFTVYLKGQFYAGLQTYLTPDLTETIFSLVL